MAGLLLLPLLSAATAPAPGLEPFERLVGQCFEAEVAPGALNVHCFDTVYRGAHVRDRHRVLVEGEVVYEGETLYSREEARFGFTYWNVLGGVGHGTGTLDTDGICFAGAMRGRPDDKPQDVALCWRWHPEGGYVVTEGDKPPLHFLRSDKSF